METLAAFNNFIEQRKRETESMQIVAQMLINVVQSADKLCPQTTIFSALMLSPDMIESGIQMAKH